MITGKKRQIYTLASIAAMLLVNFLANTLPINNVTTAEVSDMYKVLFTPAGYVFSIWGIIYIGLIAFAVYQDTRANRSNQFLDRLFPLVLISSIANASWIVAWHYMQIPTSVVLMLILLISLIIIQHRIYKQTHIDKWFYACVIVPFNIYLAWICVATIANISVFLYSIGWDGFGFSESTWAVVMIAVATGLGAAVSIARKDVFFPLVILWAIVGILVNFVTNLHVQVIVVGSEVILICVIAAQLCKKVIMLIGMKQHLPSKNRRTSLHNSESKYN